MNNDPKEKEIKKPDNQPDTDPIDKEEEVQKSNDEHIDEDFPGYPHYPAKEDILNPANHAERVDANVENLTRNNLSTQTSSFTSSIADPDKIEDAEDLGIVPGTEADVTKEDLKNLGMLDRDQDMNEDEAIESDASASAFSATEPTVSDFEDSDLADELERTGDDLDIPGEELDNENELLGEEDEENNYYSLGGDEHDNLEDDPTAQGY